MRRDELEELHFITPIDNLDSIRSHGILCHRRADNVRHRSIAMEEVQARRRKQIPGGRYLHEYANLYIYARNPMMYKRRPHHESLCILQVSMDVLDLPDVIIADQNAASDYVRFAPSPDGLALVDANLLFAESWLHPDDQIQEWRHKSAKCAEVLVPDQVPARFIQGAYVSCTQTEAVLNGRYPRLSVTVDPYLFFLS